MSEKEEKLAHLGRAAGKFEKRATVEAGRNGDYCSFCGKEKAEVARLIAGPSVLICNECIAECNRILDK